MATEQARQSTQQQAKRVGSRQTEPAEDTLYAPPVDIYETNEAVHVLADMPGVQANGVDITLENNVLTLKGHTKDHRPEGFSLSYGEYEIADYQRSFTLSDEIDREKIEARLENGVLKLVLPKAEPSRRKIQVQVGQG